MKKIRLTQLKLSTNGELEEVRLNKNSLMYSSENIGTKLTMSVNDIARMSNKNILAGNKKNLNAIGKKINSNSLIHETGKQKTLSHLYSNNVPVKEEEKRLNTETYTTTNEGLENNPTSMIRNIMKGSNKIKGQSNIFNKSI